MGIDVGSGGSRMTTSGGLINRDLEQMSKINDEITSGGANQ